MRVTSPKEVGVVTPFDILESLRASLQSIASFPASAACLISGILRSTLMMYCDSVCSSVLGYMVIIPSPSSVQIASNPGAPSRKPALIECTPLVGEMNASRLIVSSSVLMNSPLCPHFVPPMADMPFAVISGPALSLRTINQPSSFPGPVIPIDFFISLIMALLNAS